MTDTGIATAPAVGRGMPAKHRNEPSDVFVGLTLLIRKNVTNLHSTKIHNILFEGKKLNRGGCTAVRPQNIGLSGHFGQNAQHSGLEETYTTKTNPPEGNHGTCGL